MYDTYFRTVHPFPPYFDGDYWPTEVERLGLTPRMRRKPRTAAITTHALDLAASAAAAAADRPAASPLGATASPASPGRASRASRSARSARAASADGSAPKQPTTPDVLGAAAARSSAAAVAADTSGVESPRYANGQQQGPNKIKPGPWPDIPFTPANRDALATVSPETLWLRQQTADAVSKMHNDFMVAQLHHNCHSCKKFILRGVCWHEQSSGLSFCARCFSHESKERRQGGTFQQRTIKVTDTATAAADPDPVMECEFVDSRHVFLKTCEYHHYQFDTFRRAKHSSMMVLHHLRHPDPPALTHSCDNCRQTITSVLRWSCAVCKNYDLCEQCKSHNCDLEHCGQPLTPMHNLVERATDAESET